MPESPVAKDILDEIRRIATRFERVEARIERLDGRMANLDDRVSNIETVVAEWQGRMKSWPDAHHLTAAAKTQSAQTREIKAELVGAKARIDEIRQAMATETEIKSLRDEVARFRNQNLETAIRLGTIEGHVGIKAADDPH